MYLFESHLSSSGPGKTAGQKSFHHEPERGGIRRGVLLVTVVELQIEQARGCSVPVVHDDSLSVDTRPARFGLRRFAEDDAAPSHPSSSDFGAKLRLNRAHRPFNTCVTMFRVITSENFPPFGQLEMKFPAVENKSPNLAEVHLLTGINGTGKSRLLSILAAILGQPHSLIKRLKGYEPRVLVRFLSSHMKPIPHLNSWSMIQVVSGDFPPAIPGPDYQWAQNIPAFAYSGIPYITDTPVAVMADLPRPERADCLLFSRLEDKSKMLLQAVANLKMQAAMDTQSMMDEVDGSALPAEPSHAIRLARALEGTISSITGRRFIFSTTSYPKVSLRVTWGKQIMLFDALPDGLRSIIGWLAHAVVMLDALLAGNASPLDSPVIFLLDEIETALHPAWQRKILPAFQLLFPQAQIFVATHSPFVIASLNHGWIHQLTVEEDGRVIANAPRAASEGDSYVTVIEDIMGVKEWFDPETEQLLTQFRALREEAYAGNASARTNAQQLARRIGDRSMELDYLMGREVQQMDRQLAKASHKQ